MPGIEEEQLAGPGSVPADLRSARSEGAAAMKPCVGCDKDFTPQSRTQAVCSRQCASLHQHAINLRPRRSPTRWPAKTPEQRAAYGSEYRRTRDRVVAAALGSPCPGCGVTLTAANGTELTAPTFRLRENILQLAGHGRLPVRFALCAGLTLHVTERDVFAGGCGQPRALPPICDL
jgi:hypothetical protein